MQEQVAVVGGGLMGRVIAWRLICSGWKVSIFDRDTKDGKASCGLAGAGMLCADAESAHAEPLVGRLGRESVALWRDLISTLPLPVFFQAEGSLVVSHEGDHDDFASFERRIHERLPLDRYSSLNATGLAALEPSLAQRFQKALFFPFEGQLEAWDLFPALERGLCDKGATWFEKCEITKIGAGWLEWQGERKTFDQVIDCRGLGAKPDWPGLRGVRGELICVHAPDVQLTRPVRLIHPRYPLYVVPRPDNHFLIGATSLESEDFSPISVRSTLELLSAAYSLESAFSEARILNTSVNCRPALPDNLPKIRATKGLLRINGLYRHGFLLAPLLARAAFQYLQGERVQDPDLLNLCEGASDV